MESTFVRKDFYVAPPSENAAPSEWARWLKADRLKAAAAKRAWTKAQKPAALEDRPDTAAAMVKRHGRWVQSVAIGFAGDFESGNGSLEPMVEAEQDNVVQLGRMELTRNKRGGSNTLKGKSARRRANRAKKKGKKC
jgi:hypothetical protein